MSALCKFLDALLFIYFLLLSVVAPLFDAQVCLPESLFPTLLLDLKDRYRRDYGDYLLSEKPNFFIGLVWMELIFVWPLSLANIYGIVFGKRWLGTTCLIHGVSTLTSMVAILSELGNSGKASERLLMVYYPFMGFSILAVLRGLVSPSKKTALGRKAPQSRKKIV